MAICVRERVAQQPLQQVHPSRSALFTRERLRRDISTARLPQQLELLREPRVGNLV